MIQVEALVKQAHAVQPLPASVSRLAALIASDSWSIEEIEEVISLDQGLTANLLRLANSAAFASMSEITGVREAVVRMGAGAVLSLAMAASVHSRLDRPIPQYGLSEGDLWRHSVASALAAQQIGRACTKRLPPECFTAALLHDIGKLIMCRHLSPEILEILGHARREGHLSAVRAEIAVLEVHHGELGGLIAQHWGLPEGIVRGIQYHHEPQAGNSVTCHVTHLSNTIAHRVLDDDAPRHSDEESIEPDIDALDLSEHRIDEICETVALRIDEVMLEYT